jgi:hypothetical protein
MLQQADNRPPLETIDIPTATIHARSAALVERPIGYRDVRVDRDIGMGDEENRRHRLLTLLRPDRRPILTADIPSSSPDFRRGRPLRRTSEAVDCRSEPFRPRGPRWQRNHAIEQRASSSEEPEVYRLTAGGRWIRTLGPPAWRMTGTFGSARNIIEYDCRTELLYARKSVPYR